MYNMLGEKPFDVPRMRNFIYMVIIGPICAVHVALLLFFLVYGVYAMAAFNISSVALYLYLLDYLKRGKNPMRVFCAAYQEILVHSFMAAICVGQGMGFSHYLLGLVPFGYYTCMTMGNGRRQRYIIPTIMSLGSFIGYLLCRWIGIQFMPLYDIRFSKTGEFAVYVFNTTCIFVLLIWSAFAFVLDINRAFGELTSANEHLKEMAYTDPLTGLFNRRHMMELFVAAGETYSVIMCDIDDFKKVNDGYGHDFGDMVLKETAAIIRKETEGLGHVCRWGGEEVVILFLGSFESACETAERIRQRICGHPYSMYGKSICCSMTFGCAVHVPGESADMTIKRADDRLYWGKQHGKNQVVINS